MLSYPNNWSEITSSGRFDTEVYAVIDGQTYTDADLETGTVFRACFDKFAIGKAYSTKATLSFFPKSIIRKAAKVELFVRVKSDVLTSDWSPFGVFYIDNRNKDRETTLLTITAYDRMRFADVNWFNGVISGTWPKTASETVAIACQMLGISLDERTVLDDSVMVSTPVGLTVRNVLEEIAAAHAGNFVITHEGKLRLITIQKPPETVFLGDENGNIVGDENGNRIVLIDGLMGSFPSGDVRSIGETTTVSKVILKTDDETAYVSGDDSSFVLEANCPIATQAIADSVLNALSGVSYEPVQTTDTIIDPLLELGDTIHSYDSTFAVYSMYVVLDGSSCVASLSAPIQGDVSHEIPIKSKAEQEFNYKLAQTKAEIKLTTDSITSTVEGLEDDVSEISQTVSTITLAVTNGEESSVISLLVNGIVVASKTIRFTGDVVFESSLRDGKTVISGDNILTGQILAEFIKLGGEMAVYESLDEDAEIGGYLGFITSYNYDGDKTTGMAMTDPLGDVQIALTGDGARLSTPASEILAAYHAWIKTDNNIYLNADGYIYDSSGAAISSDRNAKENIQYDIEKYLPIFDKLKPCSFQYKGRNRQHLGFIAQDVEEAMIDSWVDSEDFAALVNDNGKYSLRYSEFIPMLVAKIQQQEQRIAQLEAKLNGG